MVHTLFEHPPKDEKELKRLSSLEHRVVEVENQLLRASSAALEKRVAELEASLLESNEECVKLRQTIAHMKVSEKNVIPSKVEDGIEKKECLNSKDDNDSLEMSDGISINNKEEEIIYERILKLIENMKSDCQKAINIKIPASSHLPKAPTRQGSRLSFSSKSPSPTDGLTSPSKMIGRSRTPSLVGMSPTSIFSVIPSYKSGIPSGAISPPNPGSNSQIPASRMLVPTRSPSLISQSKTSQLPSRPNTASGNYSSPNSINSPVTPLNSRLQSRPRTPSWPQKCSRPTTPPSHIPSGFHSNISTGIPSGHPQKTAIPLHIPIMRNCRQATISN
ncbi:7460_t:CDS:1 [Funneliformis geosporum]|uniref:3171_t:CDS:1 n=1 Tax=Funneliformis geosporum TaxID=1117311 RepID=A0A9W4X015_9GLOM|nr:3171_t:CDS:1 [Funneliformis geosporum]CAI2189034.1 7460_t:CDS:1 [Funneliformis geosporum]